MTGITGNYSLPVRQPPVNAAELKQVKDGLRPVTDRPTNLVNSHAVSIAKPSDSSVTQAETMLKNSIDISDEPKTCLRDKMLAFIKCQLNNLFSLLSKPSNDVSSKTATTTPVKINASALCKTIPLANLQRITNEVEQRVKKGDVKGVFREAPGTIERDNLVARALSDDIGDLGDVSTNALANIISLSITPVMDSSELHEISENPTREQVLDFYQEGMNTLSLEDMSRNQVATSCIANIHSKAQSSTQGEGSELNKKSILISTQLTLFTNIDPKLQLYQQNIIENIYDALSDGSLGSQEEVEIPSTSATQETAKIATEDPTEAAPEITVTEQQTATSSLSSKTVTLPDGGVHGDVINNLAKTLEYAFGLKLKIMSNSCDAATKAAERTNVAISIEENKGKPHYYVVMHGANGRLVAKNFKNAEEASSWILNQAQEISRDQIIRDQLFR